MQLLTAVNVDFPVQDIYLHEGTSNIMGLHRVRKPRLSMELTVPFLSARYFSAICALDF